jgi:hypothetical protein
LRHGNTEEGEDLTRNSRRRNSRAWSGVGHFRFVLTPRWAARTTFSRNLRRSSCGGWHGLLVFTSTRATPTSRGYRRAKGQTGTLSISHERNKKKLRKNPRWRKKMMRRRRRLIRVFTLISRCFIYKHILLGLRATAKPVNIIYNRR